MADSAGYITDTSYIGGFYPQLAPTALRYVAALNGYKPPPLGQGFDYLELGCGLGQTLVTLAAANPEGRFVGVDMNERHIAAATDAAARGRVDNVRLVNKPFSGVLAEDLPEFDYIVAHGILSWVSEEVGAQIFEIARKKLRKGGLLLISYNALPGWAHLRPIRDMLRAYAERRQGSSVERLRQALAYANHLKEKGAQYFKVNPSAGEFLDSMGKLDARYLVHEYLNEFWRPFYFSEVSSTAGKQGMSFVGSLPYHTNFWDLCTDPAFHDLLRTADNRVVSEIHKDLIANTRFRTDLYSWGNAVRVGTPEHISYFEDMTFSAPRPNIAFPHRSELGPVAVTVQGPLYAGLHERLAAGGARLEDLLKIPAAQQATPAAVVQALNVMAAAGLAEPMRALPGAKPNGSVRPSSEYNRAQLAAGVTSDDPVPLAAPATGSGAMLASLDATVLKVLAEGGSEGLAERVGTELARLNRHLRRDGQLIADEADRRQVLETHCGAFVANVLPRLAAIGAVEPAAAA